jgi:arylsulfatase A-like enzyme
MADRPNILFFVADQMRADAQHYLGNPAAHTPTIASRESVALTFPTWTR